MKVWAIIATVFLVASLCLNVWYYTETTSLNANVKQQLGYSYYSEYQLPFETISELRSNIGSLVYQSQQLQQQVQEWYDAYEDLQYNYEQLYYEYTQLEYNYEQLQTTLAQIQQEAERAQEYGTWEWLLQLIWSLL